MSAQPESTDPRKAILPGDDWLIDLVIKKITVDPPEPVLTGATTGAKPSDDAVRAYVDAALRNTRKLVAEAKEGTRNDTLNKAALSLGHFVAANLLSASDVQNNLQNAASQNGLWGEDPRSVNATIASGLRAGMASPFDITKIKGRKNTLGAPTIIFDPETGEVTEPKSNSNGHGAAHDLVLSPKSPMITARRFTRDKFTTADTPILHRHKGVFYVYSGSHYRDVTDAQLTSDLYHYLEKALRPNDKGEMVPFDPTRSKVGDALGALSAVTHLHDTLSAPCWLGDAPTDIDPSEVISCENGLLHLPSVSLMAHTPEFFTHNAVDYAFEPKAIRPAAWLAFLNDIWGSDPASIEALQEIFGYCLSADTSQQKAFLLIGPKRSGKGTITRVLTGLVGLANTVSPTLSGLGTNFGLSPLIGKRVAIIADARLSGRADQASIAERLLSITGEDSITIDRKFIDPWTGNLKCRFFIVSNELPRLSDASGALVSRFIVMVMSKSFYGKEDPGMTPRLLNELPGILNWAIVGYQRLRDRGYFVQPPSANQAITDLEDLGSPIGAFLRETCIIEPAACVETKFLFSEWRLWCERQGRDNIGTVQSFGRDLRAAVPALTISQHRGEEGSYRQYEGLRMKRSSDIS